MPGRGKWWKGRGKLGKNGGGHDDGQDGYDDGCTYERCVIQMSNHMDHAWLSIQRFKVLIFKISKIL